MIIDYTITAGNIIEIGSILVGGVYAIAQMRSSVGLLRTEVSRMQTEIEKIAEVVTKQAVHDQRLLNLEQDVREMRRGDGFLRKCPAASADAEYP